MRVTCLVVLLLLVGAVAVFAVENRETMTLQFFNQSISCPRWLMIAAVYLLGMVSGSLVFGLAWRSFRKVTEPPPA